MAREFSATRALAKRRPIIRVLALGFVVSFFGACSREDDPRPAPAIEIPAAWPRPTFETARIRVGERTLTVELAETAEQRRYGYMFVGEAPADDRGMLFMYPEALDLNFWMRNTRVELDLVYISDQGRVINVHRRMQPFKEDTNYRSLTPCRLALEVRGGWCEEYGVWVGTKVEIPPEVLARTADPHVVLENIPGLVTR
jgi:uncharacterized protein